MSATKEELHSLVESLAEEELDEVRDFLEVRLREPEDLTEEGRRELQLGEEQFRRGEWVRWKDIRRREV